MSAVFHTAGGGFPRLLVIASVFMLWLASAAGCRSAGDDRVAGAIFLMPDSFMVQENEPVSLSMLTAGDQPGSFMVGSWDIVTIEWFFLRTAKQQQNHDSVDVQNGRVRIGVDESGTILIGLDGVLVPRTRDGLERRVVSAKTVVTSDAWYEGSGVSPGAYPGVSPGVYPIAAAKTGQRAEIRPLINPRSLPGPGELLFEVAFDSERARATDMRATHWPTGRSRTASIDANGITRLLFDRAGIWLIEAHAEVTPSHEEPQREVLTATLTFEIPPFEERENNE